MPDSMETSYTDWVGRKRAKLKRSTLDCGHANPGDVHYHYWCDRLSCSEECANAGHDCGLFKGSKSGSEEEAVEPEAVVDPPAPRPLTLSPETYRALYGEPVAVASSGWSGFAATIPYEADEIAPPAPHADAASELDSDAVELPALDRLEASMARLRDTVAMSQTRFPEKPAARPWWRRMLPGGTR